MPHLGCSVTSAFFVGGASLAAVAAWPAAHAQSAAWSVQCRSTAAMQKFILACPPSSSPPPRPPLPADAGFALPCPAVVSRSQLHRSQSALAWRLSPLIIAYCSEGQATDGCSRAPSAADLFGSLRRVVFMLLLICACMLGAGSPFVVCRSPAQSQRPPLSAGSCNWACSAKRCSNGGPA